jgi:glycosyltransferase involved in cell wall biosynthesis
MHEFIEDGKTESLVQQNSGEAISLALNQLIHLSFTNPGKLQANCRKWVQSLNWQTVVEQHLDIYQGIC